MKKLRGLKSQVQEAVDHGSRAVEKVQIEMARTPFDLLEQIEPLKVPVKGIRIVHDASVVYTHTMIRLVNKVTGDVIDRVIDVVEQGQEEREGPS